MTVNVERANGSVTNFSLPNGNDLADAIEEIKLRQDPVTPRKSIKKVQMNSTDSNSTSSNSTKSSSKNSFFTFKKKSRNSNTNTIQNGNSIGGNGNNEKSFSNKMRKFVSNGNQNSNTKAPVSRRKKRSDSSENSQQSSGVSRSSSEPALNQPQEAFVREAPSMTSLNKNKGGRKKAVFKRKVRNSVLPSSSNSSTSSTSNTSTSNSNKNNNFNGPNAPRDPVFSTDIRTQNTRLVTPRQRQEIYALNRVMTRLENEKFKRFCHEKGFRGDMGNGEADVVEYDIFM